MRGWEQIKVSICLANLPVTILSLGGPSMWRDGPTHYGREDLGCMRTLVNMTIFESFEWEGVERGVKMAYDARTPHYVRFDKYPNEPLGGGMPFGG